MLEVGEVKDPNDPKDEVADVIVAIAGWFGGVIMGGCSPCITIFMNFLLCELYNVVMAYHVWRKGFHCNIDHIYFYAILCQRYQFQGNKESISIQITPSVWIR